MSKLHQNCSTSILVVLVLFGTQLLLTQQSNTPTHFRHPQPARLLDIVKCSGNPCKASRSLDDSDETFDLEIKPNSNFSLEVQLDDQSEILVEFIFGEFANVTAQINLFTTKSSKGSIAVAADSDVDTIIPISTIKQNIPSNRLFIQIQIQNPYSSSIYIGVTVSEPDNSLAPWIVPVAVTGGILFVIVSISMIYVWLRKRRERRQLQWIYTGNFYGGSQPNQVAVDADKDVFSIERDLDKMFPEAKNQKFKSSFPQKTCTICLEDFQGEQICRQLQCQHVFHTECVKLWLTSQAEKKLKVFCPNCHKEIVKKVEKKSKA